MQFTYNLTNNGCLQILLFFLPTKTRFPIGEERITACHGSKLAKLPMDTWSGRAPKLCARQRQQEAKNVFRSFLVRRYNKSLNNWPKVKQWVLFPLNHQCFPWLRLTEPYGSWENKTKCFRRRLEIKSCYLFLFGLTHEISNFLENLPSSLGKKVSLQ